MLFLSICQGAQVVTFFQDVNHEQQLVYNVFSGYRPVLVAVLHQLLR